MSFKEPMPMPPTHTLRCLVDPETKVGAEIAAVKDHAHFTLACTDTDQTAAVEKILPDLQRIICSQNAEFTVSGVAKLAGGTLFGLELEIKGDCRSQLSRLLDGITTAEQNGIIYHFAHPEGEATTNEQNTPIQRTIAHVTVGKTEQARELAERLVGETIRVKRIDYKPTGRADPLLKIDLNQQSQEKQEVAKSTVSPTFTNKSLFFATAAGLVAIAAVATKYLYTTTNDSASGMKP